MVPGLAGEEGKGLSVEEQEHCTDWKALKGIGNAGWPCCVDHLEGCMTGSSVAYNVDQSVLEEAVTMVEEAMAVSSSPSRLKHLAGVATTIPYHPVQRA